MTREEIIQEQSYSVAMTNEFIQKSRYELSRTEQKAVLYMVSKIKPQDLPGTEYTFSIKNFCRVCNLNTKSGVYYKYLKDVLAKLAEKPLIIPMGEKHNLITHWFASADIDGNSDIVNITFAKPLTPHLYELQTRYTKFYLENVLPMESGYGIRLYEYIKSVCYNTNKIIISLDELRERVGCEGKFKQSSELRINVIEPAIKDINLYTDIKIEYKTYKTGKKVSSIEFIISPLDKYDREDRLLNRREVLGNV